MFSKHNNPKSAQPSTHVLLISCLHKTSGFWLVVTPRCFWWSAGACCPESGHCRCPGPRCPPLPVQPPHSCRRWQSGGRHNPTGGCAPRTPASHCGTAGTSQFCGCHSAWAATKKQNQRELETLSTHLCWVFVGTRAKLPNWSSMEEGTIHHVGKSFSGSVSKGTPLQFLAGNA